VRVVAGGEGPGKRDQESLDRERARLPLAGSRWIVVIGCTGSAGQTTTALRTGGMLAILREHPVAAITGSGDGKPGSASTITRTKTGALDIVAVGSAHGEDYQRLHASLADRYPLTIVDPAPVGMTRVLSLADQLIVVVPASPDGALALANTQQWLDAHGYGDLAAAAVTVLNGVRKEVMSDVLRAESVARGRCRAIVRVPWDDFGTTGPRAHQSRLAYTALAGVLIAGLAAPAPPSAPAPTLGTGTERSPGEHEG
jgi:hypothetical protein